MGVSNRKALDFQFATPSGYLFFLYYRTRFLADFLSRQGWMKTGADGASIFWRQSRNQRKSMIKIMALRRISWKIFHNRSHAH